MPYKDEESITAVFYTMKYVKRLIFDIKSSCVSVEKALDTLILR